MMIPNEYPKYAQGDKSTAYHLMGNKAKTLCGLSVLPVLLATGSNAPLHLIRNVPVTFVLCKNCKRAQGQLLSQLN